MGQSPAPAVAVKFPRKTIAMLAWTSLLLFTVACSRAPDAAPDAQKTATAGPIAPGVSTPLPASTSKVCKLFTRAEITEALGAAVSDGADWGLASMGCEWSAGEIAVQAIVVPDPANWENLATSEGGEALSGLGEESFVAPWLGTFRAGALTAQGSVYVMSPKRDLSVALLRKAVERAPAL